MQHWSFRIRLLGRTARRWVLPKGWVGKRSALHEQAAVEAFQEAGLVGKILVPAIGFYRYPKSLRGEAAMVRVEVYLVDVGRQCAEWPEKDQRETAHFGHEAR